MQLYRTSTFLKNVYFEHDHFHILPKRLLTSTSILAQPTLTSTEKKSEKDTEFSGRIDRVEKKTTKLSSGRSFGLTKSINARPVHWLNVPFQQWLKIRMANPLALSKSNATFIIILRAVCAVLVVELDDLITIF